MKMRRIIVVVTIACIFMGGCGSVSTTTSSDVGVSDTDRISKGTVENEDVQPVIVAETLSVPRVDPNYQITRDITALTQMRLTGTYSSEYNYSDFQFDANGNITACQVRGDSNNRISFEYDEGGRIVRCTYESQLYGTDEDTWTYDEDGRVLEHHLIDRNQEGGISRENLYTVELETDELGRVVTVHHYNNGEFSYDDRYNYLGDSFLPDTYSEDSSVSDDYYDITCNYDPFGRLITERVVKNDGSYQADGNYTYTIVGSITESPVDNTNLITADEWEYLDSAPLLPIPASCIANITSGTNENEYLLPCENGLVRVAIGDYVVEPWGINTCAAIRAYDQYLNILSDVLGYEVIVQGNQAVIRIAETELAEVSFNIEAGDCILRIVPHN